MRALGAAAVVVKGCDERALVVLQQESQFRREDLQVIGVACEGLGQPKCEACDTHQPRFADQTISSGAAQNAAPGDGRYADAGTVSREAARGAAGLLDGGIRPLPEVLRLPPDLPDVLLRALPGGQEPAAGHRYVVAPQGQFRLAPVAGRSTWRGAASVATNARAPVRRASICGCSTWRWPGPPRPSSATARAWIRRSSRWSAPTPSRTRRISSDEPTHIEGRSAQAGRRVDRGGQDSHRPGAGEAGDGAVCAAGIGGSAAAGWLDAAGQFHQGVCLPAPRSAVRISDRRYGYHARRPAEPMPEQIVIGAHPCDAAALPILDKLFNWDSRDDFYNRRREATTVITVACTAHDEHCFCTSVGLSPAAERGSDVLLVDAGDGGYNVRCLTAKGSALFGAAVDSVAHDNSSPAAAEIDAGPKRRFDPAAVAVFAKEHFEDPFWREHALAASVAAPAPTPARCATASTSSMRATRAEAYAHAIGTPASSRMFTLHASGHNPRSAQGGAATAAHLSQVLSCIPKNSARSYAPAAAIARATARLGWACCRW